MKLNFMNRFSKNTQISNFMKICLVGAECFHLDRRTDGWTEGQDRQDEVNSRFSKFYESAKNNLDSIIIFYIYLERTILLLWRLPMSWRVNFCRKDYIYIYIYIYI